MLLFALLLNLLLNDEATLAAMLFLLLLLLSSSLLLLLPLAPPSYLPLLIRSYCSAPSFMKAAPLSALDPDLTTRSHCSYSLPSLQSVLLLAAGSL